MIDTIPIASIGNTFNDDPLCGSSITMYVAGCPRRCRGCHSPSLQDPSSGTPHSLKSILRKMRNIHTVGSSFLDSVVFLGGDWIPWYEKWCVALSLWSKARGLYSVLYTGEVFENISSEVKESVDWIIDGPYDETRSSVWPASVNQRVHHHGKIVDHETLPLYKHLLEQAGIKQGGG